MKNVIKKTASFTAKNSLSAKNGISLKDCEDGKRFDVRAAALFEDVDDATGTIKQPLAAIVDADGKCYTSISATVVDIMSDVIDIIEEGEAVTIELVKKKSGAGREYLILQAI